MGKLIKFDYTKKGKQDTKMCREQIKLIVNRHTVQAGGQKGVFCCRCHTNSGWNIISLYK